MAPNVNRRDFLRLAGLLPLSFAAPRWVSGLSAPSGQQNVIVVVFDALSAFNVSLYGYERDTTPNLRRLAKRAIVYHDHYAGSNFTTSGTASLLTGTLPWTHRALQGDGVVAAPFATRSIFHAFPDYYGTAYTHNPWAFTLLNQFRHDVDQLVVRQKLYLKTYESMLSSLLLNDHDIASVSWAREMPIGDDYSYSLFLSHLYDKFPSEEVAKLRPEFPRGLPTAGDLEAFVLEQAIDWIANESALAPQPFLGYFHFLPPHWPYNTSREFFNVFKRDTYEAVQKPVDVFASQPLANDTLRLLRREYDEFILYVDSQFAHFYSALDKAGLLDNTWLILTSDHGEMFERGIAGHTNSTLYQPLVRIPLMIFEPGRQVGMDVQAPTSAVDLLPTLAKVTGHAIPKWTDGTILPPFAEEIPDRNIYAVLARKNDPSAALAHASTMLVRGRYKLLYYFGYHGQGVDELVKLYDIEADPEELVDLSSVKQDIAGELLNELKSKLVEVNRPYQ